MSIDLKGNTNYVLLRDKPTIDPDTGVSTPGPFVVPRTALSAVDLIAGNDIIVENDTISVREATVQDVVEGTTASGVITANTLKAAVEGGYIQPAAAPVSDIVGGTGSTMVTPNGLKGAVSAGKAVDVTSTPSASAGTVDTGLDIKGTITWTGTDGGNFGFFDVTSAFPKYADGLVYLLMADVNNTGSTSVTLSGEGALNDTLPVTLAAGESARVAMLFTGATTGFIAATVSGAFSLEFTHLREFEVTGCSDAAREYIGTIPDPDNVDDFYLLEQDMVNPWLPIINMGDSPEVLVEPGLGYKVNAQSGAHTLSVASLQQGKFGQDAYLEIYVGDTGLISVERPLILVNALTAHAVNNCTVKFRDNVAKLIVEDTVSDYIVTVTAGTEGTSVSGSLYYGLTGTTAGYIVFDSSLNGQSISLPDGVQIERADIPQMLGNGVDNTIISGGTFQLRKVNVSDLTISNVRAAYRDVIGYANYNNCVVTGNTSGSYGVVTLYNNNSLTNCMVSGNTAGHCIFVFTSVGCTIGGCTFSNNLNDVDVYRGAKATISDCTFDNTIFTVEGPASTNGAVCYMSDCSFYGNNGYIACNGYGILNLSGTITLDTYIKNGGTRNIADGTVIDVRDNTNSCISYSTNVGTALIEGSSINVTGTATVLYNENGTTKSRAISGGGTGYIMRTNGAMGVPVTTTEFPEDGEGASGSLKRLLDDSTVSQITFAPVIDGSTINIPVSYAMEHIVELNGAGTNKSIITVSGGTFQFIHGASIYDLSIKNTSLNRSYSGRRINISNCVLANCSNTSATHSPFGAYEYCENTLFNNCTAGSSFGVLTIVATATTGTGGPATQRLDNCTFTASENQSGPCVYSYGTGGTISNCVFDKYTTAITAGGINGVFPATKITDCVFNTRTYSISLASGCSVDVSGSTFGASAALRINGTTACTCSFGDGNVINSDISVATGATASFSGVNVLGGTISGGGTVVFADGATVTSTTGTGTFNGVQITNSHYTSPDAFKSSTVTFDGVTITGCTSSNNTYYGLFPNADVANTVITGFVKGTGSKNYIFNYSDGNAHSITNTTALGILDNAELNVIYLLAGVITISGSTLGRCYFVSEVADRMVVVLAGVNQIVSILSGSGTKTGTVYMLSGSTVTLDSLIRPTGIYATDNGVVSVGTYVNDVWTPATTSDGAATVLHGSITMHVWGTGTYIDSNGTTDLQHD